MITRRSLENINTEGDHGCEWLGRRIPIYSNDWEPWKKRWYDNLRELAALCDAVRAAGSWKAYARDRFQEPHRKMLMLHSLRMRGRARVGPETPALYERLFAPHSPHVFLWHVLGYWEDLMKPF